MTHHDDRSSQLVMNLPELLRRVDNDRELLGELVDIFKEEFPRQLELLRGHIGRRDFKQVEFTGHALKGMISGLSAKRAAATAAEIERMAREGDTSGLAETVEELVREVEQFLPELDASIGGTSS